MRRVVINADDYGLSDGVCRSILTLLDKGAAGNTTMMVGAPQAVDRIRKWGSSKLLGYAGVHLHLSGGRPISPASEVRSLLGRDGINFPSRPHQQGLDPDEVFVEWSRQIEAAAELLGGSPTHLDSHHGAHRIDACAGPYLELARRYGLPVRGGTRDFGERMAGADVSGVVEVVREWTGKGLGGERLIALVDEAFERSSDLAGGVVEVISHPGFSDDVLESTSSLNVQREGDHLGLLELASSRSWARAGFELVRYPDLETPLTADGIG